MLSIYELLITSTLFFFTAVDPKPTHRRRKSWSWNIPGALYCDCLLSVTLMLGSQNKICHFQSSVKAKLSTHCIYSRDEEFQPKKMCVKWKQDDTETGAVALLEDNDFLCDVPFISLSFSCTTSAEQLNWTRTISFQYDHGHRESSAFICSKYALDVKLFGSGLQNTSRYSN